MRRRRALCRLPARCQRRPRYRRREPETTALYEVVRENLETLYGAIDDGALAMRIPKHARKELEAYLDCGLLCRGFARLRCECCRESLLVAFSCKGRGFCPSCMGRRMCSTAANLMDHVLPETGLRQWVLTFPFSWRRRLSQDGALLGRLTPIFVETVHAFYAGRAEEEGATGAKMGSVTVLQRMSSDLRLNPARPHGRSRRWLVPGVRRARLAGSGASENERGGPGAGARCPAHRPAPSPPRPRPDRRRRDRRGIGGGSAGDPERNLAASAVSGQAPPAGP
jgi:hypothetical protein